MKRRNHYAILGIARGERPEGIRAAYLRLVKEHHPDQTGEPNAQTFREIQHAYDVLSDPERRRRYDRQFDSKKPRTRGWHADPLKPNRSAEPLVPEPTTVGSDRWETSRTRRDQSDSFAWNSFFAQAPMNSRKIADFDVAIPEEIASRGGDVTVEIPVREACVSCAGTGVNWPFPCFECKNRGWVLSKHGVRIRLPKAISNGMVVHVKHLYTGEVVLRLRLLITRAMRGPPFW